LEILNQRWDSFEALESSLLKLENVTFQTQGEFAGNKNYIVSDGSNTLDIRIDNDVNLVGTPIPTEAVTIIGVLSQFDDSSPYSSGYQLLPRSVNDIIESGGGGSGESTVWDFETGLENWQVEEGTADIVTLHPFSGTNAVQVSDNPDTVNNTLTFFNNTYTGFTPGDVIKVHVWIDDLSGVNGVQPFILFENEWFNNWYNAADLTPGTWNELHVTIPADHPTPLSMFGVQVVGINAKSLPVFFVDLITIESSNLESRQVTFRADISDLLEEGFQKGMHQLEVRGDFCGWGTGPVLEPIGETTYGITISVQGNAGQDILWKFAASPGEMFIDNGWELGANRSFPFPAADTTLAIAFPNIYSSRKTVAEARNIGVGRVVPTGGVLTTPNFGASSTEYALQDGSAGIILYLAGIDLRLNYRDQIEVTGRIAEYNGKLEIIPESYDNNMENAVIVTGNNATLPAVQTLTIAQILTNGEEYESELVRINQVNIQDGTWPAENQDANLTIADQTETPLTMRIDKETDIDGSAQPESAFDVVGVITQFDNTEPYNSGYQIMPRFLSDIITGSGEPGDYTITFQADLTNFIANGWFDPAVPGDSIVVNGDFNGWDAHQKMMLSETNPNIYLFTTIVTGHPGDVIEWKFRMFPDSKWTNSGWESIENRSLTLSEPEILLDPVEPVIYYRGTPIAHDVSVTFSVDLTNTAENFSGISLQGNALPLSWTLGSNPMIHNEGAGIYNLDVLFPAGTGKTVEYKYAAASDTGWVWEAFDGNRRFEIDDSSPTQILPTDEYNVGGSTTNACAFFNGQSNRLRAADNSPINPAANPGAYMITGKTITVEAWVFPMDLPDNGKSAVLVSRPYWNADPWYAYELRINNFGSADDPRFDFAVSDGNPGGASIGVLSDTPITIGQWTHIAGTYDGSFLRLYINGVPAGEAPFTANIGPGDAGLYIGGNWSSFFNGAIDDVRLWNFCRSQADIQSAMTEPLSGDEAGLVGYWPLDQAIDVNGTYPVCADLTTNHNDLLLQWGARIVSGAAPTAEPQASPEFQVQELYGVANSDHVYRPLCYGWPEPTLTLLSGPEGMVISDGLLVWTLTLSGHYAIQLQAENSAGTATANYHLWVDPVQMSTDVHNNNNTLLSVFNNGFIGDTPYGPTGNGFQYYGTNGLFSGTLIIAQNSDQVAGKLYNYEFGTLEPVQPITSSLAGFNQAYESRFNDERMVNSIGVEIVQRTHSKSTAPDQNYVLIEYEIHNKSGKSLSNLYIGLAMDWDIGSDPAQNFGGYDPDHRLSYAYLNSETPYFGISALTGQVSGHKTWLINSVQDEGADEFLYQAVREFSDPPPSAGDMRNILGTGPYTIPENGSVNAAFAIIGGDNLEDLRINAAAAAAVDLGGEVPELSHFSPVYSGNPYLAMNIYITAATIDGISLSVGDEIGIFDGDVCVGAGVVTGGFDPYLALVASTDDPTTTEKDGFTPGHPISYRLWDNDQSLEIISIQPDYSSGDGTFASQGTAVLSLAGSLSISQTLNLDQGWNIVSFYAIPGNANMLNIFQELTGNGSLIKIQDETGNAVENVAGIGWVNNINNLAVTEGYYVKVAASQSLNIEGSGITLPLDIPLSAGWNIMGYPVNAAQSALNIVQPLINDGKLLKVQDETGRAIEELPSIGWQNGIGDFEPGKGYYIKVNSASSAIVTQPTKSTIAKSLTAASAAPPDHYLPVVTTNPYLPMNVYVMQADVEGEPLRAGGEIAIYHQDRCIAAASIASSLNSDNAYLPLIIGADDPLTQATEGFGENDPIYFKMWDGNEELMVSVKAVKYADNPGLLKFNARGTIVVNLEGTRIPKEYCLRQNYPNPFNPATTLRYELPEPGKVEIRIFDLQGRTVNQLVSAFQDVGKYTVVWNGCDSRGNQVPSGIYFYQLKSGSFSKTRKAVLMK